MGIRRKLCFTCFQIMAGNSIDSFPRHKTLVDVLQHCAAEFPDRVAFVYEDEEQQTEAWTYGELQARVEAIGGWLQERTKAGDRALLVYPAGLDFIAAFLGCNYAGVVPVPATYPKPNRPLPRLDAIAEDCQPALVLTHSSTLGGLCLDRQTPAVSSIAWEATDKIKPRERQLLLLPSS